MTIKMEERWSDIKGYEGAYQISTFGNVKSMPRKIERAIGSCITKQKSIKTFQLKGGYVNVMLRKDGKSYNHNVHRLVAEAFIPKLNENFNYINHKDGNKTNNNIENLEWCTQSANCIHSYNIGKSNKVGVLTNEQVLEVRRRLKNGEKGVDIAAFFGVRKNIISSIKNNRTYNRIHTTISWN